MSKTFKTRPIKFKKTEELEGNWRLFVKQFPRLKCDAEKKRELNKIERRNTKRLCRLGMENEYEEFIELFEMYEIFPNTFVKPSQDWDNITWPGWRNVADWQLPSY